jgi:hypothetical protein
MRSPRRLNLHQRIVIVIVLGVGLAFFGRCATAPGPLTGWTRYVSGAAGGLWEGSRQYAERVGALGARLLDGAG